MDQRLCTGGSRGLAPAVQGESPGASTRVCARGTFRVRGSALGLSGGRSRSYGRDG